MEWNLRELRYFVAAADVGSFTDAAAELRVSQAGVSRTIAAFEKRVGQRLLRRVATGCELTPAGHQILAHARRLLAEADRFTEAVGSREAVLRIGYAWAALGRHTAPLQRSWAASHPHSQLHLVRRNTPTAGLAEGACDVAIVRRPLDERRYGSVVVGLESRVVAFASDDDRWARRRQLSMTEIAQRTVVIDTRTGSTNSDLWHGDDLRPQFTETGDVDEWLDAISAGGVVGTTAEATAHHHPRPGITYRPVKDGPRVPVRLAWSRQDPPSSLSDLIDATTRLYSGR